MLPWRLTVASVVLALLAAGAGQAGVPQPRLFGSRAYRAPGDARTASLSPDGRFLAVTGGEQVRVYSTADGQEVDWGERPAGDQVAFADDGRLGVLAGVPPSFTEIAPGIAPRKRGFLGPKAKQTRARALLPIDQRTWIAVTQRLVLKGLMTHMGRPEEVATRVDTIDRRTGRPRRVYQGKLPEGFGSVWARHSRSGRAAVALADAILLVDKRGRRVRVHRIPGDRIDALAFAPKGDRLLVHVRRHASSVLDLGALGGLGGLGAPAEDAPKTPSKDFRWLAWRSMKVTDASSLTALPEGEYAALSFRPNGSLLAVHCEEGAYELPPKDGSLRRVWAGRRFPDEPDEAISMRPVLIGGQTLIALESIGLRWYKVALDSGQEAQAPPGHTATPGRLALSPSEDQLLVENGIYIDRWEVASGAHAGSFDVGLGMLVGSLPGGALLFASSRLARLDARTGKALRGVPTPGSQNLISMAALSPDAQWAATAKDDQIHVHDLSRDKTAASLPHGHEFPPSKLAVTAGVVVFAADHKVTCYGVGDAEPMRRWQLSPLADGEYTARLAFSPDGKQVWVGGNWGSLVRLDAVTGDRLGGASVEGKGGVLAFSPKATALVEQESRLLLVNLADAKILQALPTADSGPHGALFTRDGKRVFTTSHQDSVVALWDLSR